MPITKSYITEIKQILREAQTKAYTTVNYIEAYWLLSKHISEEELQGKDRAKYGAEVVKKLSAELTQIYGYSYKKTNLNTFTDFYKTFSGIFHAMSGKSISLLTWTHYLVLLQVKEIKARDWDMKEANEQSWSVRTLQRNISFQYYYRLLKSPDKKPVKTEMEKPTASLTGNSILQSGFNSFIKSIHYCRF